jgi:ribosomal protein L18
VIDDVAGKTLAAASTLQSDIASQIEGGKGSVAAAKVVGTAIAAKPKNRE